MNIQLKSYMVIIITLVVGIIIGALTHRAVARHAPGPGFAHGPGMMRGQGHGMMKGMPGKMHMKHGEFIKKKLKKRLEPTEEQWQKMEPLIDKHIGSVSEAMEEHRREMTGMMDSLKDEIDPILTPEQRSTIKELKKRRGHFRKGRPWGPGHKRRGEGRRGRHGKECDRGED